MASPLIVPLGERAYPIHLGRTAAVALARDLARWQRAGRRIAVVTDAGVARAQSAWIRRHLAGLPRITLPRGESSKCPAELARVWEGLAEAGLDRGGVVLAVGGGVVGDLAGFAAASYLRGIACAQVPTTLLAMVDSSVGGKTGINLQAGKNLAGAFHQPTAVYAPMDLLRTLPRREFAAGMAEVIKYGLLGDAALFAKLAARPVRSWDDSRLPSIVRRCCEIKGAVVAADERETAAEGGRALLNLGHTFGHAIERVAGYGTYLHGEAVAVGLAGAALLSEKLGLLRTADALAVMEAVEAHGLPAGLRAPLPTADLLAAMRRDKKVRAGGLRFVVLDRLGAAATRGDIDERLVREVWSELGAS